MSRSHRKDEVFGAVAKAEQARSRNFRLGVQFYVMLVLVLGLLAAKSEITSYFAGGRTITAEFADTYKLRAHDSSVKISGLTVGTVTSIDRTDDGTSIVTMKVDEDALETVGGEPLAKIEPRTLLGGRYAVELHAGGSGDDFSGEIPLARTSAPVELDRVAEALPATAREALRGLAGTGGKTLADSDDELNALLDTAPEILAPGADVVEAVRGTRPKADLPALVRDLDTTADVATRRKGQLRGIAVNLNTASSVLAERRGELAETLARLPETIHSTRVGLDGLTETVTELEATAADLRPSAPKIVDLIDDLDPLLDEARPLMADLKPALRDLRPAVQELVPTASRATGVLKNLHGPVLDRVNGPVSKFILNPWKGTGPYEGGAGGYMADHKFYEELAYMATNIDRASMSQDQRGSTLSFQAGVGLNSLSGLPFDLDSLVTLALDQAGITGALRSSIFENLGLVP
ncbi:MlaD family protein [Nocardioides sp. Root190]|uniref:MlaD family protein n=1 Tax=Nocardioides sp. Root190 TaxID=1736488 RepID=UPI000A967019|nr:MlaD family protein [Nocardioides sp. Root190]